MKRRAGPLLWAGIAAWSIAGMALGQSTAPSGGTGDPGMAGGGGTPVAQPPVVVPGPVIPVPPVYYQTVFGVVAAVGASSVTVNTGTSPPASVVVQVNPDTTIIRQENVDVDQLKPGDHLSVNGRPKGIVADSLESGDNVFVAPPVPLPTPVSPGAPTSGTTTGSSGGTTSGATTGAGVSPPTSTPANGPNMPVTTPVGDPSPSPVPPDVIYPAPIKGYVSASAYATGIVVSVDTTSRIILMTLTDGSSLSVDVPAGVKVHRSRAIALKDINVGDPIMASGYSPTPLEGDPGKVDPSMPPASDPNMPAPGPVPVPVPTGPFTATYIQVGDIGEFAVPVVAVGVGTSGSGSATVPPGATVGAPGSMGATSGTTTPAPGTPTTTPGTPVPAPGGGVSGTPTGGDAGGQVPATPPVASGPSTGGNGQAVLPHTVRGSLTGQGPVSVADATLALQIAVGLATPTPAQLAAGDLFGEGHISMRDVTLILRAAVFGLSL